MNPLNTTKSYNLIPANILALGDSIASFNVDLGIGATSPNAASEGFLTWFNNLRGGAHYIQNLAVSGYGTANVIDTSIPALKALAIKPKAVFLCVGTNDFYASALPAETVLANLHAILQELGGLGIKCYYLNGTPRENSTVGTNVYSSAAQTQQLKFLSLLPAFFAKFPQHTLLDVYSLVSAGNTIAGVAVNGYTYDGLHPNQAYAKKIGEYLNQVMPASEMMYCPTLASSSDIANLIASGRSKNITARSTFQGYGVPAAGLPAGFNLDIATNCTATYQLQNNTNGGLYPELLVTVTFSAAGSFLLSNLETGNRVSPGDKLMATCLLSLDSDPNSVCSDIYIRGVVDDGAVDIQRGYGGLKRGTVAAPGVAPAVTPFAMQKLCSAVFAAPTAIHANTRTSIGIDSTGAGVVIFRVSDLAIFKLPAIVNYA